VARASVLGVLVATLICSDPDCDEVVELWRELEELEAAICDCGCGLQAIAFFEDEAQPALEAAAR
jgi:hypothetical protein